MLRVAVTGGMACGKSLAGACLGRQGFAVCETDDLAHRLMAPGQPVFRTLVARFGLGIVGEDGCIDRRVLGKRVFDQPNELAELNAFVHPHVVSGWQAWLADREKVCSAAAVIVPLLYEIGQGGGWDAVVCVAAPREDQIRRLKARGLSQVEALQRINAQMPLQCKAGLADYVVINTGAERALEEQITRIAEMILER